MAKHRCEHCGEVAAVLVTAFDETGAQTYLFCENCFREFVVSAPRDLKPQAEPINGYRIIRASSGRTRLMPPLE